MFNLLLLPKQKLAFWNLMAMPAVITQIIIQTNWKNLWKLGNSEGWVQQKLKDK